MTCALGVCMLPSPAGAWEGAEHLIKGLKHVGNPVASEYGVPACAGHVAGKQSAGVAQSRQAQHGQVQMPTSISGHGVVAGIC